MPDLVKKYKIDKSTWTPKGFHGVLHTFFPVGQSAFPMKKFFGQNCRISLFIVKDNYVYWYWNDNELTKVRQLFFKRLKKDSGYLKQLRSGWTKETKAFDKVIAQVHRQDLSRLDDEELAQLYDEFYDKYLTEFCRFMVLGDAISMHADRYLVPEFKKALGRDFDKVFPLLASSGYKSFIEQEGLDRAQLTKIFKRRGVVSQKLLEAHAKKYFYINNNYAQAAYLGASDFLRMIKRDAKAPNQPAVKAARVSKSRLIAKYRLNSFHKMLIKVVEEFFVIQDVRKKYVLISNYYQFRFLRELERRSGINFSLLQYSIYPEFRKILSGKVKTSQLAQRKRACACIQIDGAYEVATGPAAESLLKYLSAVDKTDQIKGITASLGCARGRVKVLLKIHDLINVEAGDVIVSSMTRPEMTPAMKKAAAIITDEGGLTSHAAIVSRELKIPCIIGTKVATKLLKDGDLVEVDADKGVVNILKRV